MEVLSPTPQASPETQARRRGRKPGRPLTPRELAARRANLEKARAALREGDRRTEKRLRASRANLEKAIAARRSPKGNAAARLNALKHGLFARQTLVESVARLGESRQEFDLHLRRFGRIFIPAGEEEKRIVRELAQTVWRRLRFFGAQLCWEEERLRKLFARTPARSRLSGEDTVARAEYLALALINYDAFFRELSKLQSQVEFWLRTLIRKRSRGRLHWRFFSPRRDQLIKRSREGEKIDRFVEIWDALSPDEQAALRDEVQKKVAAKMADWNEEQGTGG